MAEFWGLAFLLAAIFQAASGQKPVDITVPKTCVGAANHGCSDPINACPLHICRPEPKASAFPQVRRRRAARRREH